MARHQITLQVEGTEPGRSDVRLSDFVAELEALRDVLRHTDEAVTGGKTVEWRVVSLSKSSPGRVGLWADLLEEPGGVAVADHRDAIIDAFLGRAQSLNDNRIAPPDMGREYLQAFKRLAAPVTSERLRATVSNGSRSVEIARELEPVIDAVLAPTTRSFGSALGKLEYMDIHAGARLFRIYSEIVPKRIICHFPDDLLGRAKDGIGRMVAVYGEITYRERDPYPDSVRVDDMEVMPPEGELPTLGDLYGMAPGSPDDLPAEELVRAIRDE